MRGRGRSRRIRGARTRGCLGSTLGFRVSTDRDASARDARDAPRAASDADARRATRTRDERSRAMAGMQVTLDVQKVDAVFFMYCATLVFAMQIGFALLEVGSVSIRNTKSVLVKNVLGPVRERGGVLRGRVRAGVGRGRGRVRGKGRVRDAVGEV